ncbi:hypothetical protein GCM10028796_22590 [Ramlibacter monticola]|uniref:DUF4337 domain-containing protein n=1 Tax=Ramlibacter monticola TaxID=1926872 RepID=A0A936Z1F0_9BURK|nr:DUF4337 domain-containing protein [Ramlibacter monticola]MBL0392511.1 DUF4337 domain-containing protein [Ramlibacter monticola]
MDISLPDPSEARASRLNAFVAIAVALLTTFMGICKVKDDNIVQAMQQAQADKLDHWAFYQARNQREEVARAALVQLRLAAASQPADRKPDYDAAIANYEALVKDQATKKEDLRRQAQADQDTYDHLNFRDDQFDLSDAAISISVALLAVASLTQRWWLFLLALLPAGFGTLMGAAGLAGWQLHPTALVKLLT